MAWFRAATGVARHALRRTLIARATAATRSRGFDTSALRRRASAPAPRAVPSTSLTDSFLDGTSSVYLQRAWEADPSSVDESWDNFFRNFLGQAAPSAGLSGQTIQESMQLLLLVRAYQVNGHMKASLDPLGLDDRAVPEDLDLSNYGFTEADLDSEFFLGVWMMSGFLSENRPLLTLREILSKLEQAYCRPIGFEQMHIPDRDKYSWLREKIETISPNEYEEMDQRLVMLDRLIWSTQFENFLATKWATAKKFGLEGGETLIPGMKEMFDRSADLGVENIVIGMPHTGRLNVLVNDHPTRGGKMIQLSIANPTHLEAVVVGKTRSKQFYSNDASRTKNMGILINGGDSFAEQCIISETLHVSALSNYTSGGTIHIGGNHQVAFTTDPRAGKFSLNNTQAAASEGLGRVLTFGSSSLTFKSKRMLPLCTHKRTFSSTGHKAPIICQLMCYDDYEIKNVRWRYFADCIIKGGGILKPMSPVGRMRNEDIIRCGGYELGTLSVYFLRQGAGLVTINLMRGRNVSALMRMENLLWSPERRCLMFKEYDVDEDNEGTINPYRALYDTFDKAVELSTGYNLRNLPYPLPKHVDHFLHYLLNASITDKRLITNHSVTRFPVERIQKKMTLNNLLRRRLPFQFGQAGSERARRVFAALGKFFPLELLTDDGLQPAIDYWARKATELRGDFNVLPGALSPVVGPLNEHGDVIYGNYRIVALGRILVALMRDPFEHPNGPGSDLGEPFCSEVYDHIDIEKLLNSFVPGYLPTAEETCLTVGIRNLLETNEKNRPAYESWTDTSWQAEDQFPDLHAGSSASFLIA